MASSAWLLRIAEDALARPDAHRAPAAPPTTPFVSPEEGASAQAQALLLIAGFALPAPNLKPIRHGKLLL